MNKEDTKEAIEVMQAFVNGEEVECDGVIWMRVTAPGWNWDRYTYRIKPKKPRLASLFFDSIDIDSTLVIELTDEVKAALEKAGISYANQ